MMNFLKIWEFCMSMIFFSHFQTDFSMRNQTCLHSLAVMPAANCRDWWRALFRYDRFPLVATAQITTPLCGAGQLSAYGTACENIHHICPFFFDIQTALKSIGVSVVLYFQSPQRGWQANKFININKSNSAHKRGAPRCGRANQSSRTADR